MEKGSPTKSDMGHNHSTPRASPVWSNVFEPIITPLGECQTVRTTYNIYEILPLKFPWHRLYTTRPSQPNTSTTRFFDLWAPSNLFNAVQPLKNDYKVRAKIRKCLSSITRLSPTVKPELQLPIVINAYLARQHSPKINEAQLSTYFKVVYEIEISPECTGKIRDRICNMDANISRGEHVPPYERFEKLWNRLSPSDPDRSIPAQFKSAVQDLVLFMDSVWLSMSPSAQEATINEWKAYAESDTND